MKGSLIQSVFNAKTVHKNWICEIEPLISSIFENNGKILNTQIDNKVIAFKKSECQFGEWFEIHFPLFTQFEDIEDLLQNIKKNHNGFSNIYTKLYNLLFDIPENSSIFSADLSTPLRNLTISENETVKLYWQYLERSSDEFLNNMNVLEAKVKAVKGSDLKKFLEEV